MTPKVPPFILLKDSFIFILEDETSWLFFSSFYLWIMVGQLVFVIVALPSTATTS